MSEFIETPTPEQRHLGHDLVLMTPEAIALRALVDRLGEPEPDDAA